MEKLLEQMEHLNFFAGLSVVATTALTIMLFLNYAQKKLPPADGTDAQSPDEIDNYWYVGLFGAELYAQLAVEQSLSMYDAISETLISIVWNVVIFFICYGVLSVVGVDKENLYERCKKAFMGLVILLFALLLAFDHFVGTLSTQNIPANTAAVSSTKQEFVINLNNENIYIDRNSLVRIGNAHEDAAPEFKCVLIDDADIRTNCEFHARGIVIMYVDGVAVGDSIENPEIEKLYDAIVKKFL